MHYSAALQKQSNKMQKWAPVMIKDYYDDILLQLLPLCSIHHSQLFCAYLQVTRNHCENTQRIFAKQSKHSIICRRNTSGNSEIAFFPWVCRTLVLFWGCRSWGQNGTSLKHNKQSVHFTTIKREAQNPTILMFIFNRTISKSVITVRNNDMLGRYV